MGVLDANLVATVRQRWASPRLTCWFVGVYCAWVFLGTLWGWYRLCDVNAAASARVAFIHTTAERIRAYGDTTIHRYVGDPHLVRFVGDARLRIEVEQRRALKLSLQFHHVRRDERMTIRRHPEPLEHTVESLFSHGVTVWIPLIAGENDVDLCFKQRDVQYTMSTLELVENETTQRAIMVERAWIPFFKRGGVHFSIGSGWFLPPPKLTEERPVSHTGRQAYLLLTADEPGDYELSLSWLRSDRDYGPPSLLLDGKELPAVVTPGPPESQSRVKLRLEKEHVLSIRLNERITSALSRRESRDQRFLGYQVPWKLLRIQER